jgi:UDP-N-acetylglucosamine acyltransferase
VSAIHATALVDPAAELGQDVEIGPYCIVGPGVRLGDRVQLKSHVVVEGATEVGADTVVYAFANLGGPPQHLAHKGEATRLVIGAHNTIREHVTMHTGTVMGGGVTRVGSHSLFMVASHVAHDCIVGDHVVFENNATRGVYAHLDGLNLVGLKRRGFSRDQINDLRAAYRLLFAPEGTFQERLDDLARVFAASPEVSEIVNFIRADANRPICLPALD